MVYPSSFYKLRVIKSYDRALCSFRLFRLLNLEKVIQSQSSSSTDSLVRVPLR